MYGIINKAIEELAIESGGQAAWDQIRERAGCADHQFGSMEHYPDELTYQLIDASSEVFGIPPDTLLHSFGLHWILYTSLRGFGPILNAFGTNVRDFLGNLNLMHSSISGAMPKLKPPGFIVDQDGPKKITVHYFSDRPGLAPMVCGLLEGLGERFKERIRVQQTRSVAMGADHDEFEVCFD